jgi:hypothetical protein
MDYNNNSVPRYHSGTAYTAKNPETEDKGNVSLNLQDKIPDLTPVPNKKPINVTYNNATKGVDLPIKSAPTYKVLGKKETLRDQCISCLNKNQDAVAALFFKHNDITISSDHDEILLKNQPVGTFFIRSSNSNEHFTMVTQVFPPKDLESGIAHTRLPLKLIDNEVFFDSSAFEEIYLEYENLAMEKANKNMPKELAIQTQNEEKQQIIPEKLAYRTQDEKKQIFYSLNKFLLHSHYFFKPLNRVALEKISKTIYEPSVKTNNDELATIVGEFITLEPFFISCNSVKAEDLLKDQPKGTYLVRPSKDFEKTWSFALSYVGNNSKVEHMAFFVMSNGSLFSEATDRHYLWLIDKEEGNSEFTHGFLNLLFRSKIISEPYKKIGS